MTDATNGRRVSDSVLNTLARVIADAKAGSVEAVVIIAAGPDGMPCVRFAGESDLIPSLNLGIDMMKASWMAQIIGAPGAAQMRSGIVLPGDGSN